jgi:hypothetical protein
MNVTQTDLNNIQNSANYKIKYCSDTIYYVTSSNGQKMAFTHGNIFTMFNAPDLQSSLSPLPVGHFVTRAI